MNVGALRKIIALFLGFLKNKYICLHRLEKKHKNNRNVSEDMEAEKDCN